MEYSLDGVTPSVYTWTGVLNQNATAVVSIPPLPWQPERIR
jgi:hypothetical protein